MQISAMMYEYIIITRISLKQMMIGNVLTLLTEIVKQTTWSKFINKITVKCIEEMYATHCGEKKLQKMCRENCPQKVYRENYFPKLCIKSCQIIENNASRRVKKYIKKLFSEKASGELSSVKVSLFIYRTGR